MHTATAIKAVANEGAIKKILVITLQTAGPELAQQFLEDDVRSLLKHTYSWIYKLFL
jgi:hypothetical protein